MSKEVFALDIGTRKVMGIIASLQEVIRIEAVEVIEHVSRPMFDGQIHSIEEVAAAVSKIKLALESRTKKKLRQVAVAVAGRNLVTFRSKVSKAFEAEQEVTQEMIRGLEFEGVEKIVRDSGNDLMQFYCVGYSPRYYELDGEKISTLLGHRARSIAAEVIVTFLPRVVLDSMFSVLKKAGLEATNITLEPIAALGAIIPEEMRNLNIVLVDIGAGTSDLALTKDGNVYAYAMVAEAGDEITEHISRLLLTDFSTAERIKRKLDSDEGIEYEDIWGKRCAIEAASVKKELLPAVRKLAQSIAGAGLDLNGGPPHAVVAVGGGSLTPLLMQELTRSFGVAEGKAGIRLPYMIRQVKDLTGALTGPEAITPIGIALMAVHSLGLRFMDLEVNGRKMRMLDFQQKKDIMGALTLSGALSNKKLYPRPGLSLTVEVNGQLRVIKGTLGEPARVRVNGRPVSSLTDRIESGDVIEFQEALDGKDGSARVGDLTAPESLEIFLNKEALKVCPPVTMDGEPVAIDAPVHDRAKIEASSLKVRDVLRYAHSDAADLSERQILVNINGAPRILTQRNFTVRLNAGPCELDTELGSGDEVEFAYNEPTHYRIRDVLNIPPALETMRVNVDGEDIEVAIGTAEVFMNGNQVKPEEFLIDGADVKICRAENRQVLLSEIFKYIEFDPYKGLGKNIRILVNGSPAGFTTPLKEGSRIRILFEDRQ